MYRIHHIDITSPILDNPIPFISNGDEDIACQSIPWIVTNSHLRN
jgi:hypothetical protein